MGTSEGKLKIPYVLESIPPVACTACGQVCRYAMGEQSGEYGVHDHRVLVLYPYPNEMDWRRPEVPAGSRPRLWMMPLVEADLPVGTLLLYHDEPGKSYRRIEAKGPGPDPVPATWQPVPSEL